MNLSQFRLLLITFILLISCSSDDDTKDCRKSNWREITWLSDLVSRYVSNQIPGSIELYCYNNQEVFLISDCIVCTDPLSVAYDRDKNEICRFGGIAGVNTCPDFEDEALLVEKIY